MDAAALSKKYVGDYAEKYDRERQRRPQWMGEESAVDAVLSTLPRDAKVIDVPVGTGRFVPLYTEYGLAMTGVDTSPDMLRIADERAQQAELTAQLHSADIRDLPWPDNAFDAAVCIRLFQWFSEENVLASLKELARVSKGPVVFSMPSYMPLTGVRSAGTALRYLKQLKLRFYKWRTRSDLLVHKADAVTRLTEAAALRIRARHPIAMEKYEYAVYVAEKT